MDFEKAHTCTILIKWYMADANSAWSWRKIVLIRKIVNIVQSFYVDSRVLGAEIRRLAQQLTENRKIIT